MAGFIFNRDVYLSEELLEGSDQVLIEVEFIVVHLLRKDESTRPSTFHIEFVRVSTRD